MVRERTLINDNDHSRRLDEKAKQYQISFSHCVFYVGRYLQTYRQSSICIMIRSPMPHKQHPAMAQKPLKPMSVACSKEESRPPPTTTKPPRQGKADAVPLNWIKTPVSCHAASRKKHTIFARSSTSLPLSATKKGTITTTHPENTKRGERRAIDLSLRGNSRPRRR